MHASSAAICCRALSAALIAAMLAMFSLSLAYAETDGRLPLLLLVRHAEKLTGQANDNDPPLSPAGRKRAEELAAALRESGVNAIITTELRRTRETAAPLAAILALTPEVIAVQSSGSRHIKALERTVHRHTGEVVLVVAHANTVPISLRLWAAQSFRKSAMRFTTTYSRCLPLVEKCTSFAVVWRTYS